MAIKTPSNLPVYSAPAPTTVKLEYAKLATIDLSKATTCEGREELAREVCEAMTTQGFFYAINHGYTQEQTNQVFSVANLTFDGVDSQEKALYTGKSDDEYEGYKPKRTWHIENGIPDEIEHYNIHRSITGQAHPTALQPYIPILEAFSRHNYYNILHPLLRLLAKGLELPEDALTEQHDFDAPGLTSLRFMKYYPRTEDQELKTRNVWLKGHTDFGSITILWSQPVAGLQILSPDGKWRWIRHVDNAVVINAGDALDFLCGGYYPPTRHRVIQPPADQNGIPRLGVFYFCQPNDDVKLVPHVESHILQTVGVKSLCDTENAPTMREWRKGRTKSYGKVELKAGKEVGVEEEMVHGLVVKHYN